MYVLEQILCKLNLQLTNAVNDDNEIEVPPQEYANYLKAVAINDSDAANYADSFGTCNFSLG